MKIDATAQFWRTKGLSVRASNCLAKANIANEQELIHKFTTFDSLIALRNCGRKTAEEIWEFLINLNLVSNCDQGSQITWPNPNDQHFTETQSVFIPLLNIIVSAQTWKALQKTPVNSIRLSFRTRNVINQQRLQELAEVAKLSPREWLRFRNFGRTSLRELQERMTETIEQFRANPQLLDLSDRHSHSIEAQWVFLPLLNIIVSAQTWEALQKISVNSISWRFWTRSAIKQQRLQQLADLCQFLPRKLLSFSSFSTVSLRDIQEHLTETIEQLQANSNVLDSNLDHFFQIFIPLLNIKVSANTWKTLQNRSIHQSNWSGRVQNILLAQDFKTLADIAELHAAQWLKFRNCGRKSLIEIQETVNKVIANLDVLEPKGDQI